MTLTLSTTFLYEMCKPNGQNFMTLNPESGNVTLKFERIAWKITPVNEQNVKEET
jgi:hypothetical protein